ncbi:MAG: HlyD family efflux transporter periplasmic adaptor subunit [Gemmatimonadota bacterium]
MDIIREQKPKRNKRIIQATVGIVVLILITWGLRSLKPAAPSVDRATVWTDTVQFGTMVRAVRGNGTLVPVEMRYITAVTAGRVEQRYLLPGIEIDSSTVILRLSNPDVEVQLLQSQQQLSQAEAQLITLRSGLETQRLTQEGMVAQMRTQSLDANRVYGQNQRLFERNPDLVAKAELERSQELAEELETRLGLERERLQVLASSVEEQIEAQRTQVGRLQAIVQFNAVRLASLEVTAGVSGVLAELPVQEGEWVQAGGSLARVVQPGRLRAEVRIPQTQAQDISVGQRAYIDTRNDTIIGTVSRIDPAVQNASVLIDVALPDSLPRSARPDLSIDGTVEIERLEDVIYVGRPAFGNANSRVGIFKLVEDGNYAERVSVQLGASSVNEIQVLEGLQPGDVVILSPMDQWDGYDRVRLRG